ncbi:MAG: glycosyltransferase family 4 protein [Phycisphaerales bacterium]|nr:MAG: glycosyltransferase family 4 protein [Phycisphaerales bacterium]
MALMSDADDSQDTLPLSVALCAGERALDHLGCVLRYLSVGLVDQAVSVRLLGIDPRIEALTLGPIQSLVHEPLTWPWSGKRTAHIVEVMSHQPPTSVHALTSSSYELAASISEAFDADLVLQVSSLADCDRLAQLKDKRVGCHLVFSKPLIAILEGQLGITPDHIELVRAGILASKQIACFANPDRTPAVLCTAPFEKGSGIDQLIEAIAILGNKGHEVLGFFLGQGKMESALRRLVRQRNLSAVITFAKPLGDIAFAMQSADIFVRPAAKSCFDIHALQAMGMGMAVVTPPDTICDYLREGETAAFCAQPNAVSLAGAIELLLLNRSAAKEIAAAGREYVRTHHAMSVMADRAAAVYRRLALARATFAIRE